MPKFLLTYRAPSDPSELDSDTASAWMGWFGQIQDSLVQIGDAVGPARQVGNVDGDQRVGGYSVIQAADLDAAADVASTCPAVANGYGVEIGQLLEIDAKMPTSAVTA